MKTILCYGDSNTWGQDGLTKTRYPLDVRWTGVLRQELGDGYWVVEEGLCGRTTVWDDPIEGEWKNGLRYLMPCLESQAPIDLVVLMLGTNDLKNRYAVSAFDIANGLGRLIATIQQCSFGPQDQAPQVLLVAPPPLGRLSDYADMFVGGYEKSTRLGSEYKKLADLYACEFLDASQLIRSSDVDGVHLDPDAHHRLGLAVAEAVRRLLT
jgi:lysophospholipase L1-like esterase